MKKTLVALAALSAISAFAQSSVQITGYMDRGLTNLNSTNSADSVRTVGSSAGTTRIEFRGQQDLGNGNSAGFFVETDWAEFGGASQTASVATTQKGSVGNGESFISLGNAATGTLKLGAPNSFTLGNATGVAAPAFSTGIGSSYSTKFSIANGINTGTDGYAGTANLAAAGTNSAVATGARAIRINNTIQYVSPTVQGFAVGVNFTPKNNNVTASPGNGNTVGVTEYSVRYTQGPLDAQFTNIKYTVGDNGTSQYTLTLLASGNIVGTTKPLTGSLTSTQSLLGATYQVNSALKLHGGLGQFSSSDNATKGASQQVGVTYTAGLYDFLGQYVKVNDSSTSDYDRSLKGFGVNYNLSKTTRLYARADYINYSTNQAAFAGTVVKRSAIGISQAF